MANVANSSEPARIVVTAREADLYGKLVRFRNAEKKHAVDSPFFDGLLSPDEFEAEFEVESIEEFVTGLRTMSLVARETLERELDRGFSESQAQLIARCRETLHRDAKAERCTID